MKKLAFFTMFCLLLLTGCNSNQAQLKKQIEKDFSISMDAYQNIWQSKNLSEAEKLAAKAFHNKEVIELVLESYQQNLEDDQGIKMVDTKYDISILNYDQQNATLKVKAFLKGYPISLSSGEKKVDKLQDFSFGPHNFEMTKEQGSWKLSSF